MPLCVKRTFFSITGNQSWPSQDFVLDCPGAVARRTLALPCHVLSLQAPHSTSPTGGKEIGF